MKELIRQRGVEVGEGFGTHSMKATLLSWAAKRGLPPDVRTALGYHVQVGQDSTLTYSRDALARPLRKLEAMLSEVRLGTFDPDVSRSGRLVAAAEVQEDDADVTNEKVEAEQEWTTIQNHKQSLEEEQVFVDL